MNMININIHKNRVVALQIIGWTLVISATLYLTSLSEERSFNYLKLIERMLPALFIYIVNYTLVIPRLLFKRKPINFVIVNIIIIAAMAFFTYLMHEYVMLDERPLRPLGEMPNGRPPGGNTPNGPPGGKVYEILNYFLMVGFVIAVRLTDRLQESEQALQEAETARVQAELENLKGQLNPHFMLNTLNNIYTLTVIDADKAQKAIRELSRMLRYLLYENNVEKVQLQKEVEFIENYIELMRIRLNSNVKLDVEINVDDNTSTQIAPMIFISLIENAFKHGVSADEPSFIDIKIDDSRDEGCITLTISNSNHAKTDNDKSGHGIGLEQVRKRLDLQYADTYKWDIKCTEEVYYNQLTIKA